MMYEMIIPRWHFHMLNDFVRNSSYARAISEAVACIPDCSVLDIGSGTGLLRCVLLQYNVVHYTQYYIILII